MARKLVVSCDGTWNDEVSQTNIWRAHDWLRRQLVGAETKDGGRDGWEVVKAAEAVLYYDKGVGTAWYDRLIGGGIGAGLSRNVCQAYQFLCRRYRQGDEIFIFGFSRGAYTARSLAGFIGRMGGLLPEDVSSGAVARAYLDRYVRAGNLVGERGLQPFAEAKAEIAAELEPDAAAPDGAIRPVTIRFLGVYDTVGALGVPTPLLGSLARPIVRFHDTALGGIVQHAVQALAVDERRVPFEPVLWTEPDGGLAKGQTCLQVWFPGVHSDVGGGYPRRPEGCGIADITFDFMMRQAAECGLVLDKAALDRPLPWSPTPLEELPPQHDSFSRWYRRHAKWFGPGGAGLQRQLGAAARGSVAAGREMLHPSLIRRWNRQVTQLIDDAAGTITYQPPGISWPADAAGRRPADVPVFSIRADGVRLAGGGQARLDGAPCEVLDRSPGGAKVAVAQIPATGREVSLDGRRARVVWARNGKAGLRFAA